MTLTINIVWIVGFWWNAMRKRISRFWFVVLVFVVRFSYFFFVINTFKKTLTNFYRLSVLFSQNENKREIVYLCIYTHNWYIYIYNRRFTSRSDLHSISCTHILTDSLKIRTENNQLSSGVRRSCNAGNLYLRL